MKNQRTNTQIRSRGFLSFAIVLVMLATLICCFTVMTSAAGTQLSVDREDLDLSGLQTDASKLLYKTYDGTTAANVGLDATNAELGIAAGDDVQVKVNAAFNSKNVADANRITVTFTLTGADAGKYIAPAPLYIDATIKPVALEWAADGTAATVFESGKTTYKDLPVQVPALKTAGIIAGDTVSASTAAVTVTAGGVSKAGEYTASAAVALTGADAGNYTVAPLTVKVNVAKIEIVEVRWATEYTFAWGDKAANEIEVYGYDANSNAYKLIVSYPEGYGAAGSHTVSVSLPDADNMAWAQNNTATTQKQVLINKLRIEVEMPDATYLGNEETQDIPDLFTVAVVGDMPAAIRELIKYTSGGADFYGESACGTYPITATLPTNANYEFVNKAGEVVTELSATLTINKKFVAAAGPDAPYQMILIGSNGFAGDVSATVTIPEQLAKKAIRGFAVHKAYTLKVTGAGDATFTVLIPVVDSLYNKNCSALTANDLYVYENATGEMVKANTKSGYTVTYADGYYSVEGVSGSAEITFVIAPVYNTPFALTPVGITLWVLLALAIIAIVILVGMYIRRVRQPEGETVLIIDTEGDVPEIVPVEIEDKVDEDAFLEDAADKAAESADGVAEDEEADTEGLDEAIAEAMSELTEGEETEEVAEAEAEPAEEGDLAEDMADKMAEDLADSVDAETDADAEADEDALREAVDEAMGENFNESADASDAVVIVAEEDDSDEITPEDFKAVVDAIVSDAMCRTMVLPEEIFAEEEAAEDAAEEATEAVEVEETAEAVEEATEAVEVEETAEAVEEATEAVEVEETAEAVEEATEAVEVEETVEAVEETETAEEEAPAVVVEEMSGEDICAVVADSVAEAFELVTVDGVVPAAVEGLTAEMIADAAKDAADANVPETWTEEMATAVTEAVADELAARLLTEEPAVEAFVAVEEPVSEDDDDDDDNDEDDSFFGFGSMPLDFIDAVAEADRYAEMLEQERLGEVRLVTRYRRSYTSRMIQSQGNVQDYYTIIKNALLSHKGVKNRISWNYEAFNRGRTHVAKINAKTKTLYLYLALDPEELKDTKYGIVDVSSKKKYASVPVLMKIKGERKFKYALELIEKLCEENLGLPKLDVAEVDYRMPYQTTEELVESGVVKKLVAAVPVSAYGAESTEEAPVEAASATAEAQEVTFVEPTTAPAVEAAAEEAPVEDAPIVEETPADAPASTDEPTEV